MATIAERISWLVDQVEEGNKSEFARQIEVTPAYISKLSKEPDREPRANVIERVCKVYSVNRVWLETGAGDPFLPKDKTEELKSIFSDVLSGRVSEKNAFIEAVSQLPDDVYPILVKSWIAAAEAMKEKLGEK